MRAWAGRACCSPLGEVRLWRPAARTPSLHPALGKDAEGLSLHARLGTAGGSSWRETVQRQPRATVLWHSWGQMCTALDPEHSWIWGPPSPQGDPCFRKAPQKGGWALASGPIYGVTSGKQSRQTTQANGNLHRTEKGVVRRERTEVGIVEGVPPGGEPPPGPLRPGQQHAHQGLAPSPLNREDQPSRKRRSGRLFSNYWYKNTQGADLRAVS